MLVLALRTGAISETLRGDELAVLWIAGRSSLLPEPQLRRGRSLGGLPGGDGVVPAHDGDADERGYEQVESQP